MKIKQGIVIVLLLSVVPMHAISDSARYLLGAAGGTVSALAPQLVLFATASEKEVPAVIIASTLTACALMSVRANLWAYHKEMHAQRLKSRSAQVDNKVKSSAQNVS